MARILLIQDDLFLQTQLQNLLKKYGYEYLTAASVNKGISILEADPQIDVIISSIEMNERPPLDFLRRVKQIQKFQYIPVILTCKHCDTETVVAAGKLGAADIVTLPAEEQTLVFKIGQSLRNGKLNILIVYDDPQIARLLKQTVELERLKAITVTDAENAMKVISDDDIAVVITDILLPQMTGFKLISLIKNIKPGIPVILISSLGDQMTRSEAIGAGADECFIRPFRNIELIHALRRLISGRSQTAVQKVES